jgi:hypothetical protein
VGSPVGVGEAPTVTPLTLSSQTKATLFGIMLWRCWASFEHGIAHLGTHALQVRSYSASGLADLTPRVLTSSKFLPTQGIVAATCVNPRFVAEYRHSAVMAGVGGRGGKEQMATLDEIGQEKQRISERLARPMSWKSPNVF